MWPINLNLLLVKNKTRIFFISEGSGCTFFLGGIAEIHHDNLTIFLTGTKFQGHKGQRMRTREKGLERAGATSSGEWRFEFRKVRVPSGQRHGVQQFWIETFHPFPRCAISVHSAVTGKGKNCGEARTRRSKKVSEKEWTCLLKTSCVSFSSAIVSKIL